MSDYSYWQAAVRGEKPKMFVDDPQLGFYRKGINQRNDKGNSRRVGWTPVAVFMVGDVMTARVGDENTGNDVTGDALSELWSYIASNAITEETYRAVARHGKDWPDAHDPKKNKASGQKPLVPAVNRDVGLDDNAPPTVSPEVEHATAIDNAIAAAPKKVTNETEAALALGSKNRIAELRLAADKAGKSLYQPPYQEYQRLYGAWNPMVKRAEASEELLTTALLTFREGERKRIAAEKEQADAKQREIDEANERAAQRAIAAAQPEPAPVIEEVEQPAPMTPIAPTYGTRKLKEEVKRILEKVTDFAAVYSFLKDEPKVKELLTELAAAKVKAGYIVPGTVTREGLI